MHNIDNAAAAAPVSVNAVPLALLTGPWRTALQHVVASAREHLYLCTPYVSIIGADCIRASCRDGTSIGPSSLLLTDLSPRSVCQGATDPAAVSSIRAALVGSRVVHLPRVHAKVYCADGCRAVITSGNLTSGGLNTNHECGLLVGDAGFAGRVEQELLAYASLGAEMDHATLENSCDVASEVRAAYKKEIASASSTARRRLANALREADDALIRARLGGGATHTVFARTIEYLLRRHGPLSTNGMHPLIQHIHPDLCDDGTDRVIDGRRFGKKWKHAVRTAQQQLKKTGTIALIDGRWHLLNTT